MPKLTRGSHNPNGRRYCGEMRLKYIFLVKHIILLFSENEMRPSKKSVSYISLLVIFLTILNLEKNTVSTVKQGGDSLIFLGFFAASGTRCLDSVSWHYEIWRLPKNSGAQCRAQCRKADLGQRSRVWPKAYFKKLSKCFKTRCRRVLKWPAMSPDLIPI